MKLNEYLRSKDLTDEVFASVIGGGTTARRVKKWRYGETRPRLEDLARIEEVTGGVVRLVDFISAPSGAAAAAPTQELANGEAA